MNEIVAATPMGDGSPRQCLCGDDIEIGSPAALNTHGVEFHPECVNLSRREAQAARDGADAPLSRHSLHSAAPAPVGDLGDQVAARMLADRGISRAIHTSNRAADPLEDSPVDDARGFLRHCEALGPINPRTGLRPGQDLQDAVAERLLENRVGVL